MKDKGIRKREHSFNILPGFVHLEALWLSNKPVYPSEQSARWAARMYRRALIEAGALALFRGKVMVHPEKFAAVISAEAIKAMRDREHGDAA